MNVFQTNVTLARAPDVAAVAAQLVGQSDLLVRQATAHAASAAVQQQEQVAGAAQSEAGSKVDLEQRSLEGRRQGRRGLARPGQALKAEAPDQPGYSPRGVGRRLDRVV